MYIREIYRRYVPIGIRYAVANVRKAYSEKKIKKDLAEIWASNSYEKDYKEELRYLVEHDTVATFPYLWAEEYKDKNILVKKDARSRMHYVEHKGNKLFFPRNYSTGFIRKYYASLIAEQDARSPHYYFDPADAKWEDMTFVDIGGAEGIISLEIVDKVKRVIIFEGNKEWQEALRMTFKPWEEKVQIISQFVGDITGNNTVSLDVFFRGKNEKMILKLDVEGSEKECLKGAERILKTLATKVFVCTYHNEEDGEELSKFLERSGYQWEYSKGWMFYGTESGKGSFRKGLIRATK